MIKKLSLVSALILLFVLSSCGKKQEKKTEPKMDIATHENSESDEHSGKMQNNDNVTGQETSKKEFTSIHDVINELKTWNNYKGSAEITYVDHDLNYTVYLKEDKKISIDYKMTEGKESEVEMDGITTVYEPSRSYEPAEEKNTDFGKMISIGNIHFTQNKGPHKDFINRVVFGKYFEESNEEIPGTFLGLQNIGYSDQQHPNDTYDIFDKYNLGFKVAKSLYNKNKLLGILERMVSKNKDSFKNEEGTFKFNIKGLNESFNKVNQVVEEMDNGRTENKEILYSEDRDYSFYFPYFLKSDDIDIISPFITSIVAFYDRDYSKVPKYPKIEMNLSFKMISPDEAEIIYALENVETERDYIEPGERSGMKIKIRIEKSENGFGIEEKYKNSIQDSFICADLEEFPRWIDFDKGLRYTRVSSEKNSILSFYENLDKSKANREYLDKVLLDAEAEMLDEDGAMLYD